jgi:hypothetical protein
MFLSFNYTVVQCLRFIAVRFGIVVQSNLIRLSFKSFSNAIKSAQTVTLFLRTIYILFTSDIKVLYSIFFYIYYLPQTTGPHTKI